jgi:GNAT superfamily N-acetyltransferase
VKSLLQEARRLSEFVRWRNPFFVFALIIREICRPFMYWFVFDIFETDLRLPIPESYSKEKLDVRVYEGTEGLKNALVDLVSMDRLVPADIELRLGRGDAVAIAYAGNNAVGCIWLTFTSGIELGFGTSWVIQPSEALRYGAFVHPGWRGRAIYSVLNNALNRYARERGILRTLGGVSVLNSQSQSLAKHHRKLRVMRVIIFKVRGAKWVYRKAIGAPLESRFCLGQGSQSRSPRPRFAGGQRLRKIIGPVTHLLPSRPYRRRQRGKGL